MTLTSLPPELLAIAIQSLEYASDLNALAQTCKYLREMTTPHIYPDLARSFAPGSLLRLARSGNADAFRRLLFAGAKLQPYIKVPFADDPLTLAAARGHVEVIKTLVEAYGIPCLKEQVAEKKVSIIATEKGQINVLRYLLGVGVRRRSRYDKATGKTIDKNCLGRAAAANQLSSLRFLLDEAECEVNAGSQSDHTALYWASRSGCIEAIKLLLEAGADLRCRSTVHSDVSPLQVAALEDKAPMVEYLLQEGAYQDFKEDIDTKKLAHAAIASKTGVITKILDRIDWDEVLPTLDRGQRTDLLFCAALYDNDVLARRIMEGPCDTLLKIQRTGGSFCSALTLAAYHGNVALTQELLGHLGTLPTKRAQKRSGLALFHAIYNGQLATVTVILDFGGNRLIEEYGVRALMISTMNEAISQELCRRGALKQTLSKSDKAWLVMYGLLHNNLSLVEQILDQERIHVCDNIGPLQDLGSPFVDEPAKECSVIELAALVATVEGFKMVLARGPALRLDEPEHHSALADAVMALQVGIIELFLDAGFNVNGGYQAPGECSKPLLFFALDKGLDKRQLQLRFPPKCTPINRDLLHQAHTFPKVNDPTIPARELQTIRMLIDRGADVNASDDYDGTALFQLVLKPRPRKLRTAGLAKELTNRGADPLLWFETGGNALKWAIQNNETSLVDIFLSAIQKQGPRRGDLYGWLLSGWVHEFLQNNEIKAQNKVSDIDRNARGDNVFDIPRDEWDYSDEEEASTATLPSVKKLWVEFSVRKSLDRYYWRMKHPVQA